MEILAVHPARAFPRAIQAAAQYLREGKLVAFPTESFYGLAADATNEAAIGRLFAAKERPAEMPILLLVPSLASVTGLVRRIPAAAERFMASFWPGGLTLVFEAAPTLSPRLTAHTGRIGLRLSSHPVATALTQALGHPISGTSANVSGHPPCRTAADVGHQLGERVSLVLDGGPTGGQAGSTVLDVTTRPPQVLRPGMISRSRLEQVARVE